MRRPARIWRRRLVAVALILLALAALYRFWLRDSSLFAVESVEVKGLTANRDEVTASLERAGEGMTTLHIDDAALAQAVSGFPTVASIAADATLPHKLTVTVTERLPVAVVKVGGEPTGVAADGLLLPGLDVGGQGLPEIDAESRRGRLDEEGTAQAQILGGASERLRRRVEGVTWDEERGGVVVSLEGAPEARFGDGSDAAAKWKSLSVVLLRGEAGGAGYVDVSVPGRPVAGG